MTNVLRENALRLGAPLREYRAAPGAARKLLGLALGSACLGTLLLRGLVSAVNAHDLGGAAVLWVDSLTFFLPAVLAGYVFLRYRGARVTVHERGFTLQRGNRCSTVLWNDVESYIAPSGIRVVTKSGEVVELGGGIEGIDEIAQTISEATLKLMLPQLKAVLMSGSNAEFKGWKPSAKFLASHLGTSSGFTVDALGITEKDTGRRILWSAVTRCEVSEQAPGTALVPIRMFRIADQTQTFATCADLLSNAHVLLALCSELANPSTRHG